MPPHEQKEEDRFPTFKLTQGCVTIFVRNSTDSEPPKTVLCFDSQKINFEKINKINKVESECDELRHEIN